MASCFQFLVLFSLVIISQASFANYSNFQDFCVADLGSQVFVNGFACKNPNLVTADDFFFSGLDKPGNTSIYKSVNVTYSLTVQNLPGLNTLGISLARHDFAPGGMIPSHYHPRATEVLVVIEGTIEVGMISSINNKHFSKDLIKGDVFVIRRGLLHYKYSRDKNNAVLFSAMNSQNSGEVVMPGALLGQKPSVMSGDVIAKAFRLAPSTVYS